MLRVYVVTPSKEEMAQSGGAGILHEIEEYFAPVPVKRVPLFAHEVLGIERLEDLARVLYAEGEVSRRYKVVPAGRLRCG